MIVVSLDRDPATEEWVVTATDIKAMQNTVRRLEIYRGPDESKARETRGVLDDMFFRAARSGALRERTDWQGWLNRRKKKMGALMFDTPDGSIKKPEQVPGDERIEEPLRSSRGVEDEEVADG